MNFCNLIYRSKRNRQRSLRRKNLQKLAQKRLLLLMTVAGSIFAQYYSKYNNTRVVYKFGLFSGFKSPRNKYYQPHKKFLQRTWTLFKSIRFFHSISNLTLEQKTFYWRRFSSRDSNARAQSSHRWSKSRPRCNGPTGEMVKTPCK